MEKLTKKEKEIYLAICEEGIIDFKTLAEKFCISPNTIQTHYQRICQKTLCSSRAELIFQYYKHKKIKTKENIREEIKKIKEEVEDVANQLEFISTLEYVLEESE